MTTKEIEVSVYSLKSLVLTDGKNRFFAPISSVQKLLRGERRTITCNTWETIQKNVSQAADKQSKLIDEKHLEQNIDAVSV